ncbi:hypothetical protein GON03_14630 [Nocardioides sp. MAH-18]|uniref:Uncharacterized protein n=1 Tax=Nocardioides agri TaxID=2682843 RepID=A0A6L6XTA4_9ACTN|nr:MULTISPECIES: hypothetical protein [unclassified Nocardioides]MBA2955569.1 hypothetical protein [Nocardioides sp. CGMCC 1.13656]MVQ50419.1 hypothetical protein [Nocardioides sp. MAH-18]
MGSVNADGARLLGLVHDEIAQLGLTDTALVAALEEQVARTVAEVFPHDRSTTDGDLVLTDEEAGRVALAVMTAAASLGTAPAAGTPTGPLAADLTTGELLRAALGARPRG